MTKTAALLTLIVTALASMPAQAQRVFVSGLGSDTNPCTVALPCRTFQQAYNSAPANAEIDVLDPAGYGPLTITHGISIQAHGFGGITAASGNAITVNVTGPHPVTLNGLLLDGAGTGGVGIDVTSVGSIQILNSVVRHFAIGIQVKNNTLDLLIEDTIVSENPSAGISAGGTRATLNRITANNNSFGVFATGLSMTIANSVISNSLDTGLYDGSSTTVWLAKTVISGNPTGVAAFGTVNSYGDNYIRDNGTPVANGTLTSVGMQ
jgi:hypothetical protein